MEPSEFPDGLMVIRTEDGLHTYRLACTCTDPRDDFTFDVEYDPELNEIILRASTDMFTRFSNYRRFWLWEKCLNAWQRVSIALRVLVVGYYETGAEFSFKGDGQLDAFLQAIAWSREKVTESGRDYGKWKEGDKL